MADIKIDYSEIPEIFFNGIRQKRVYVEGNTEPIWPINSTTGNLEYAITFNPKGGTVKTSFDSGWERTTNGCLKNLPEATSSNKTFLGWSSYLSADFADITTSTVFTNDTLVYAVWDSSGGGDSSSINYIQDLLSLYTGTTLSDVGVSNGNMVLVAKAIRGSYYILQDSKNGVNSYLLIYNKNAELATDLSSYNLGDIFDIITGTLKSYDGTLELTDISDLNFTEYNIGYDREHIREFPVVYYYENIATDIFNENTLSCPQPIAIFVTVADDISNVMQASNNYIRITIPNNDIDDTASSITVLSDFNDNILNSLSGGEELIIYGYMIWWYGTYKTILAVNYEINNGGLVIE